MFSDRVPADQRGNRLSKAIEARRALGAPILDLTESNPTRCGFRFDADAIGRALSSPGALPYEPHPQGLASAREAVAHYYAEKGTRVRSEDLFLTASTSEGYAHLFKLLADPGDEVLAPVPGYPLLEVLARLEALRVVPCRAIYDRTRGWRIDAERLRATVSTRTAAVAVASPNNPTGSYLEPGELEQIGALCRELGLALIVDEVFSDYPAAGVTAPPSAAAFAGCLTFTLSGFSKILGLPQVKLSWIHVAGPEPAREQAKERLAFVNDAFLSLSTPVQQAAGVLLEGRRAIQGQILARLRENSDALAAAGLGPLAREGGWYAILPLPDGVPEEETALALLEEDGVLAHPGFFYDFPAGGHLVVSLLTRGETFRRGIERLAGRLGDRYP
jgi:alanine-synthesizing transaminase